MIMKQVLMLCGDINTWDVSSVTEFSFMFKERVNFSGDISNSDTLYVVFEREAREFQSFHSFMFSL